MVGLSIYVDELMKTLFRFILTVVKYGQKRTVPPAKDEILLLSATALASQIRSGKLTSQKVVETYIERIKEVQPYIRGLAEDRFDLALKEAIEVDELIASRKMTIEQMEEEKPLLGVPFAVKCMIAVEGMGFNASCCIFKGRKADRDSDIVERMKRNGAIVIGTSNMPELALNSLAKSKLYGQVRNPLDSRMFPGISSSGDVALNSAAAIPLGIANDFFGSVRIPCLFCGIFGHRPTCGLIPPQTTFPRASQKTVRKICHCPTSRHAEDLVTAMKGILGPKGKELGIGEPVDFSKLTIYYTHSFPNRHVGLGKVDDDLLWTILRVGNYFKQTFGSKVEYIDIEELAYAREMVMMESKLGFESGLARGLSMSGKFGSAKVELLKSFFGKSNILFTSLLTYMAYQTSISNFKTFPALRIQFANLCKRMESLFQGQSILLYPSFPKKFIYTEECPGTMPSSIFSAIFSFLEVPVTQCQVGYCDEGLPLGLQVIAGKNQDNLTLSVAVQIQKGFGNKH